MNWAKVIPVTLGHFGYYSNIFKVLPLPQVQTGWHSYGVSIGFLQVCYIERQSCQIPSVPLIFALSFPHSLSFTKETLNRQPIQLLKLVFYLLWQNLKWQKTSIRICENYLPFDVKFILPFLQSLFLNINICKKIFFAISNFAIIDETDSCLSQGSQKLCFLETLKL